MTTLIESQRLIEPVEHAFPITPNDSAFLEHKTRGIIIGGSQADVDMTFAGGERETLTLAPGMIHAVSVIKVWATGTTATDIYGLW
jgi:hypothetical protein